ncbi:DUF559 domain-containing protein [Bifidobacterium pullorum subsp. saeculare]|uniref:DUF559 domain-containing protein n=1 Tax=Bifidobacterium pullorum subsp. saeculare TaxID=78257 RepID=A0A938WWX0_9BIFI|nr:endonuclease domain-containing protein [Bifidobacterium pullorum]MBM6699075.1 DUF559 domain-containing protein [Bifidobacterium pullorum subsp. saeculare]
MPIPYNARNVPLARELRKNMTPWERHLWFDFLRRHTLRWQRQKPVLDYIVDFYCDKARLAVELDGGGHYHDAKRLDDERRTAHIGTLGIAVCRYANNDVDRHFDAVCDDIDRVAWERLQKLQSR